ncbi:hypothetical protein [Paenibacillus sp. 1P03SA]|uniref:hypothetical protein n=1 Tax=Paenibacillus sp. 1P03SA TaxID=3132294 RepID=UPI0039A2AE9E
MIKVTGTAWLNVDFEAVLDMTEEEFEVMPEHERNILLDTASKWREAVVSAEVDEFEVNDIDDV